MPTTIASYSDMAPSPRAVIDLDPADLDPATVAVTVVQLSKWGTIPVRGVEERELLGGLVATDYDIPPGVPVTYRVQQFDQAGTSLGFALSLSAQVEVPKGKVVIQDPFAPAQAVMLDMRPGSLAQLRTEYQIQRYRAGRFTTALAGLRSLLVDVPFIVATDTDEQRDQLNAILAETPILIRADPSSRLPGSFYAAGDTFDQAPHDPSVLTTAYDTGSDDWSFQADQVSRPSLAIIVALLSYDLFRDFVAATTPGTYDDAHQIWLTYLDALRNPPTEESGGGETPPPPTPSEVFEGVVLQDSPLGFWRLSDGAPGGVVADASGNGNDATAGTTTVFTTDGPVEAAATFDGTNQAAITLPAALSIPTGSPITIEYWRRATNPASPTNTTVLQLDTGVFDLSVGDLYNNRLAFQWGSNNLPVPPGGMAQWADGVRWYHVALTVDGAQLRSIYVNGSLIVQDTAPALPAVSSGGRVGGPTTAGWAGAAQGSIAEVAVYDHALTPDRILAHFEAGGG